MCRDAFKKASHQLHSNYFGLKQLPAIIKPFITTALEYKAVLKL